MLRIGYDTWHNTMIIYYIETYLRSSAQAMTKQIPDLLWQATDRHEAAFSGKDPQKAVIPGLYLQKVFQEG